MSPTLSPRSMREQRASGAACVARAALLGSVMLGVLSSAARASDLGVETGAVERSSGTGGLRVSARVSWKNAWRNAKNHDAVWLFVKVRTGPNATWRHARLLTTSRSAGSPIACEASGDRVGIFCQPAA